MVKKMDQLFSGTISMTSNSITDKELLKKELNSVKEKGQARQFSTLPICIS